MRQTMKKFLPVFLALSLFFAMVPVSALAEGEQPLKETIHIASVEDLEGLAENCRLDSWSQGRIVVLDEDLDLRDSDFTAIPTFGGTFEGQDHTIQNFKLEQDGSVQGFFRYVQQGAVVRNLNVSGQTVPGGSRTDVGGLAGSNGGCLENCTFRGIVSGASRVGGIAGTNTVTGVISGCTVGGNVYGNHFVGGLAGQNNGVISGCTNNGSVNTTVSQNEVNLGDLKLEDLLDTEKANDITDIGGVAGASAGVIRGCVNRGAIGYAHIGYNVGGIAGSQTGYVEGCVNYGAINGRKEAGGIVGQMEPSSVLQYSEDTLQILQGELDTLQSLNNRACSDAAATSSEVTAQLNDLKNRVDEARQAVDALINNTVDGITPGSTTITITDLTKLTGQSGSTGNVAGSGSAQSGQDASLEVGPGPTALPELTPEPTPEPSVLPEETPEPIPTEEPTPEPSPAEPAPEESGEEGRTAVPVERPLRHAPSLEVDYEANQSVEGSFEGTGETLHNVEGQLDSQMALEIPTLELNNRDSITAARSSLNGSLASIVDSVGNLNANTGDHAQALIQDIQAITRQLNKIAGTLAGAAENTGSDTDLFEDVSDEDTEGDTEGKVFNCINAGEIHADINAGGIAGAMARENDLDPEDDVKVAGSDSLNFTYKRRVVVRDCINNGEVTAKKQCMGGIVGLMDMGTVLACTSYADMDSESADYVGGIAGRSKAVIRQCAVKAKLSGADYVGGIAGSGATVTDCRSLVLTDGNEKVGAVLGGTESGENDLASQSETISGNCFLGSEMGGIDGISYAGQAEPLDYETWKTVTENDGLPETFRTFTLRFVTDEETVAAFTLDYDAAFDRANEPEVPQVSGCTGAWEEYESDAVRFDQTVKAVYTRQSNVLESTDRREDGRAVVLIEGNFGPQDAVTLTLMEDGPDGAAETWQLALPGDGTEPHTVHYLPAETKNSPTILVLGADGNWREVPTGEDGSYLVFNLNAGETTFAEQPSAGIPLPLLIGGLAAALLLCIFAVVSHRKKKRAAVANAK
ncbi:MAG: hypothetical protein ACI4KN_07670 [Gemmiger sp.]